MTFFVDENRVMNFDGLECVKKNTFLHFLEDNANHPRASRSRSAPNLLRRSIDSSAFVASYKGLTINAMKQAALADSDETDQLVESDESAEDVQTVMIRGIPCSCNREDILKVVEELGFYEQHDFFKVPMKRNRTLGYAFISFSDPQVTKKFAKAMTGYRFKGKLSSKVVTVSPASIQGKSNNFDYFKGTSVMQSEAKPFFVKQRD